LFSFTFGLLVDLTKVLIQW